MHNDVRLFAWCDDSVNLLRSWVEHILNLHLLHVAGLLDHDLSLVVGNLVGQQSLLVRDVCDGQAERTIRGGMLMIVLLYIEATASLPKSLYNLFIHSVIVPNE